MKQRNIPYGYTVKKGENIIHPIESKVVQQIFSDYLNGDSLLKIAELLTNEKVAFLPSRWDWNKSRIKRILEDNRYLGNSTYPALISEDIFSRAQTVKNLNNNQNRAKSKPPSCLPFSGRDPFPVICSCEKEMKRRSDFRRKVSQQFWRCANKECRRIVNINDDVFLASITELLNLIITEPTLIKVDWPESDISPEIRRLNNEVNYQLDSFNFEKEQVQANIISLAAEKYRYIEDQNIVSRMLRAVCEKQAPLSLFSPELLEQTVEKIQFDESDEVTLILKNKQNIRKESGHADSKPTSGKKGADDPGKT